MTALAGVGKLPASVSPAAALHVVCQTDKSRSLSLPPARAVTMASTAAAAAAAAAAALMGSLIDAKCLPG